MRDDPERIAACLAMLERRCREAGSWISGDGRIGEEVCAALLGLSAGTLANRRCDGSAPPHYRLGGAGHRVTYSLQDLAEWIERHRVE
jgi:predicted DNA-binding transcriptional regulator AlpA